MTKNDFDAVAIGEPIEKVQQVAGKPYRVKKITTNQKIYIYIERFRTPNGTRHNRHYLFDVVDGRVKGKSYYVEGQKTIEYLLQD